MAALIIDKVEDSRVSRGSVIENDNGVVGPLNADLTVLRVGDVVEEELEQGVAFLFLEADDAFRIHRVDEETFLSRDIVRSDDGVNASNARVRVMLSL